jgi:hypothetical protein
LRPGFQANEAARGRWRRRILFTVAEDHRAKILAHWVIEGKGEAESEGANKKMVRG